jgi:hypothetical protein
MTEGNNLPCGAFRQLAENRSMSVRLSVDLKWLREFEEPREGRLSGTVLCLRTGVLRHTGVRGSGVKFPFTCSTFINDLTNKTNIVNQIFIIFMLNIYSIGR